MLLLLFLGIYFAVGYAVMKHYGITCVFLEFFGFPCPGCGMTRAFLSLLKLDFVQAARYNVVIFFMPYVFLYILFDFRHPIHRVLLWGIAVVTTVNWIIKIIIFL